jgi:ATP-dependent helicase HrpA
VAWPASSLDSPSGLFCCSPLTPPRHRFLESLEVSAKRDESSTAITAYQVVIVCGETGSNKTTQLPKIALSDAAGSITPQASARLIGHAPAAALPPVWPNEC